MNKRQKKKALSKITNLNKSIVFVDRDLFDKCRNLDDKHRICDINLNGPSGHIGRHF